MSRKQELALLYTKERRRVQSFYSRYRKKNYAIPENAIPARPKRITEGSIRRLQRMTPEFMKRKLVRYEKQLKREERRKQREATRPTYSYDTPTTPSYSDEDYQTSYAYTDYDWYDAARIDRDATYLQQIYDNEKRVEFAERYYGKKITDMSEEELKDIGYIKTSDGYIIRESTSEIVARDMSEAIKENNDFISQLEEESGEDLSYLKPATIDEGEDVDFSWDDIKADKVGGGVVDDYSDTTFTYSDFAHQIINNFINDISKFRPSHKLIKPMLDEFEARASEYGGQGTEAIAKAIEDVTNQYGRMTYKIAYSDVLLNEYADALNGFFENHFSELVQVSEHLENLQGYETPT